MAQGDPHLFWREQIPTGAKGGAPNAQTSRPDVDFVNRQANFLCRVAPLSQRPLRGNF